MPHHERTSNVTILGIIALVCVALVIGSYLHKRPEEVRVIAAQPQLVQPQVVQPRIVEPQRVTQVVHHYEREPRYEREYAAPAPVKPPVSLEFKFGYQKTVGPRGCDTGRCHERARACKPKKQCPQQDSYAQGNCAQGRCPQRPVQRGWTSNHQQVVIQMNKFVEDVLDNRTLSAQQDLDQAKNIIRSIRNGGGNVQAVNNNGVALYGVVQDVVAMVSAQLPAHLQRNLNELFSLLR